MAIKLNGNNSPMAIKYMPNNRDVQVVKYNNNTIWSKPLYIKSISASELNSNYTLYIYGVPEETSLSEPSPSKTPHGSRSSLYNTALIPTSSVGHMYFGDSVELSFKSGIIASGYSCIFERANYDVYQDSTYAGGSGRLPLDDYTATIGQDIVSTTLTADMLPEATSSVFNTIKICCKFWCVYTDVLSMDYTGNIKWTRGDLSTSNALTIGYTSWWSGVPYDANVSYSHDWLVTIKGWFGDANNTKKDDFYINLFQIRNDERISNSYSKYPVVFKFYEEEVGTMHQYTLYIKPGASWDSNWGTYLNITEIKLYKIYPVYKSY